MNNFYIYVDRGGYMPQLSRKPWDSKTHPYYVRYVNNKPVAYRGPLDVVGYKGKLWDYSINARVQADRIPQE